MPATTVHPRQAEWRKIKGQIVARWGTLTDCAQHLECSPQSLRMCILTDVLPGVRDKLLRALEESLPAAAAA